MRHHLDNNTSKFITYPKFVFLCGKGYKPGEYEETNRGITQKYLCHQSDDVFIVLSERLWEDSFDSNIDLLTFEEFLAEVSDSIILFAESPGSFCELGAFAYAENLFSDKLIIVIDEKYRNDKSFIITGPTMKAAKNGAQVVYAPLGGTGLLSSFEFRSELNQKIKEFRSKNSSKNKRTPNIDGNKIIINSFILELLELIRILQPISKHDLIEIYKKVKEFKSFTFVKRDGTTFNSEIKIEYVMKLLETVGLIDVKNQIVFGKQNKSQPLMFTYGKKAENMERNKLICRKYRYRGPVK